MKKAKQFFNTLTALFSGLIISSLWISHNDWWKLYLPLILICIGLRNLLDDAE